jgi:hypothetical protein
MEETVVRPNIKVPGDLWRKVKIKATREEISLSEAAKRAFNLYAGLESLIPGRKAR